MSYAEARMPIKKNMEKIKKNRRLGFINRTIENIITKQQSQLHIWINRFYHHEEAVFPSSAISTITKLERYRQFLNCLYLLRYYMINDLITKYYQSPNYVFLSSHLPFQDLLQNRDLDRQDR